MLSLLIAPTFYFRAFASDVTSSTYCISRINSPQDTSEHVAINFFLKTATDQDGWTWKDRVWDGDFYRSGTFTSPDRLRTVELPELYTKPCSKKEYFWGHCSIASSLYSTATGTAFIRGYERNTLGLPVLKSYAMYSDKIIPLAVKGKRFVSYRGDVDNIKMAALAGLNQELILFNREKMISLPIEEVRSRKDGHPAWLITNDPESGRSFIQSNGAFTDSPMFLYEILKGPALKRIDLDENIIGVQVLLSLSGDKQEWIFSKSGIFAEKDNKFVRVAHPVEPEIIWGPADVGLVDGDKIYFRISENYDSPDKKYLVLHKSEPDCEIKIDLNKDTALVLGR